MKQKRIEIAEDQTKVQSREEEIKPCLYPDGIHWQGNGRGEEKKRPILSKRDEDPITSGLTSGFDWSCLRTDEALAKGMVERDGVGTNGVLIASRESGWKWWMIEETVWNSPWESGTGILVMQHQGPSPPWWWMTFGQRPRVLCCDPTPYIAWKFIQEDEEFSVTRHGD